MARKIDKTIKLCVICGDKAKGINFNVLTCMSCKAFFRRNALRKKDMKCPFNDTCQIDKITRKFCSKCRLKKCFESGMKKEWILSDEEKRLIKEKIMRNKLHKQQQQIESCSGRINNDHNNKHHKKLNNSNSVEQKSLTTHRKRGRKSINQSLNSNNSHESNNIDDNLPIADATNQSLINQEILISNDLNDYHSEMTSDKSFFNQFVTSNSNNGSIDQYNFNSNNNNFDLNNLNNTVNTSYIDPFESILELTTATTTTSTSTSMVSLSSTASTISSPSSSPLNQSIMTVTTTAKTAPSMTAAAKTTATIDLCRRMFTEPHAYNLDTILTMDETDIDFDSGIGFIDINQRFQIAHHHLNNNNSNINISNNHYYYQRCPTLSDTYLNNYHNNNNNISLMNQLQPQQHSKLNSNSISINNNNLNDDSDNYYYDSGVKTMIDFDEFNNNLNNNNNNYSSNNNNLNTNNFINIKAENDNFNETNINNTNNINKNVDSYFQTTSSPIPSASSPANIIENMNFDLTTIDTFDNTDSTNKYQSKSSSVEINDKLIKESESQSSLFMNENNSLRPNLCDMENIDIDIDINNMNKIESIENNIINNNNTDTDTQLVTDDEKLIINSVNIEDFSQYLLHDNDPPLTYQQRRQQQQQQHQESSSIHSNRFNMDQSNKAPFNESLNAPSQIDNQMMIIAANHSNNNLINDGSISLVDDGYDSISHHKLITPSSNSMNISKYFSYIDDGESIPITRPISSVNDDELMLEELLSIQELSNACLLLKNPYKRIQYSTLFCKNPKYPSHLSHGCGISEFYIHRLIRMSKRLRSFATLIRSEQIDLLRSNIIDMLIIRSILFYDPDRDAYCFVDDKCKVSIMVDTEIIKPCCIKYDYERHMNFKAKFRHEWKNDNIIFDLLTAIVLFTPRSNQDQNRKIRQEYSRYTCLLYRYLQIKYGPNSDDANESFKILMSLIDELRLLSEDISKLFSIYRVIHSYPLFMDLYGFNNDGNNSNNSSNDTMIVAKTNHCMPPPSSATSASASRIKNYIDFNMNNDYHHQQQRQIQQQNYSSTHSINNNSQNNECCEFVF